MDFDPSKLGTLDHWQSAYTRELDAFASSGDEGEVWFGQGAVDSMVLWIRRNCPSQPSDPPVHVLDVGTGNGHLLHALVDELDYPASSLTGIDYAPAAIQLATRVTESKGIEGIRFEQVDFLREEVQGPEGGWDLVTDKGTFDAIALSDEKLEGDLLPRDAFPSRIARLVRPGGRFLITSCNFTDAELLSVFESTPHWKLESKVEPRRTFSFGGKTGSTTVTLAFRRLDPA